VQEQLARLSMGLEARRVYWSQPQPFALRLFNGFQEGIPGLVIDLFGHTAVLYNHADPPGDAGLLIDHGRQILREKVPLVDAMILKTRASDDRQMRYGILVEGEEIDRWIREDDVRYALDLTLNQDASFYLDTRVVRRWAKETLGGKSVLNTFAYTGSLGVAAMAGGASRVVHLDLKRRFLNVAKSSYSLNGFAINKGDFLAQDFFSGVARMKREGVRFDCVILDPPFFSTTNRGRVDLSDSRRLINKVRPLIHDGGWLVSINNALYVSGERYVHDLENLCQDGYLEIEELIPVPEDVTGFENTRVPAAVSDPAPFNHSTKIALLRVRRKD